MLGNKSVLFISEETKPSTRILKCTPLIIIKKFYVFTQSQWVLEPYTLFCMHVFWVVLTVQIKIALSVTFFSIIKLYTRFVMSGRAWDIKNVSSWISKWNTSFMSSLQCLSQFLRNIFIFIAINKHGHTWLPQGYL